MSHDLDPAKLTAFLAEYEALCRRHGLYLAPDAYDLLQVWPLSTAHEQDPFERVPHEYLTGLRPVTIHRVSEEFPTALIDPERERMARKLADLHGFESVQAVRQRMLGGYQPEPGPGIVKPPPRKP